MITLADVLAQQLRDLPIRVVRELMLEVAERRARDFDLQRERVRIDQDVDAFGKEMRDD